MHRNTVLLSLGAAMTFALAGCSLDTPSLTPPDLNISQEQADMAATAVSMTEDQLDLMFASSSNATGMASLAAPAPGLSLSVRAQTTSGWQFTGPCAYNADTQRHECETVDNGKGISLDRSYAFYDVDQAQEAFDELHTDSINFQSHLSGTQTGPNGSITVIRTGDVTVAGDPTWDFHRLWNGVGEGTLSLDYTDGTTERSYDIAASTMLHQVVTAVPHSDNPWPLSGTFSHTFEGQRTGAASTTLTYAAVITFNGGSVVPLDIGPNLDHLDTHLCIDLDARKVADATCRNP